jgi:hypothetical protein
MVGVKMSYLEIIRTYTTESLLMAKIFSRRGCIWEGVEEVCIAKLDINETLVNYGCCRGRFKNLCYNKLWKNKNKVISEETDFFICKDQFTLDPYIDWISENITNKWSFRVKSNLNRYTIRYEFLFEKRIDAAYFSLRWR